MILEQLISLYLDGEVSAEQDAELRALVSADPLAKRTFDAAVLLHIALACEDQTQPPSSLRAQVLGTVNALAGEQQQACTSVFRRRRQGAWARFAPALTIVLLLLSVPISDADLMQETLTIMAASAPALGAESNQPSVNHGNTNQPAMLQNTKTHKPATHAFNHEALSQQASSQRAASMAHAEGITYQAQSATADEPSLASSSEIETQQQQSKPTIASLFSSASPELMKNHTSAYMPSNSKQPNQNGTLIQQADITNHMPEPPTTSAILTTSYAAGSGSSVQGTGNVRQLALSIGFRMGNDGQAGIEVGNTEYDVRRTTYGTMPVNGSRSSLAIQPTTTWSSSSKFAPQPSSTLRYRTDSAATNSTESLVWASAYYECTVLELKPASITARFAGGVSEDGLLGYGRLVGRYQLGSVVSLAVGAEFRGMNFRVGSAQGIGSATAFGTTFTALTGVYVKF